MIMEGQNQAERKSIYIKIKFEENNLDKIILINRNLYIDISFCRGIISKYLLNSVSAVLHTNIS